MTAVSEINPKVAGNAVTPVGTREEFRQWLFVGLAVIAWLSFVIILGLTRSAWMDEFFVFSVTRPETSLGRAYLDWKVEPHPPTYTFLVWLWRHVVEIAGQPFAVRAMGIAASFLLIAGALMAWRSSKRPDVGIFALFLLTTPIMLFYPQEARSYFLSALGGAYCSLYFLSALEGATDSRPSRSDIVVGVIGAILVGTHVTSLMYGSLLFGILGLVLFHFKRWAWLRATIVIAAVVLGASIVFTGVTIFEGLKTVMSGFWVTRRHVLGAALETPWNIGIPLLLGLGFALVRGFRSKEWTDKVVFILLMAIAASVFVLFCLSMIKPMIVVRYLAAPIVGLAPPVALIVARYLARTKLSATPRAALASGALLAAFASGAWAIGSGVGVHSMWRQPAEILNAAPACKGAIIPTLVLNHAPDERNLWRHMFAYYAPDHRFLPATPEVMAQAAGQSCPVRLWVGERMSGVDQKFVDAVHSACAGPGQAAIDFDASSYVVMDKAAIDALPPHTGKVIACDNINLR